MSEGVLTVLKFCLLAALYLFLARVVWVVAGELRGSARRSAAPAPAEPVPARRGRRSAWRLAVLEPAAERGNAFDIDGEVTIGRAGGCGIALPGDTFVSQVHARVFDRDGDLYVEDLGSTNGTFLNGEQVHEPLRLKRGDRLHIGQTELEVAR
jgi:hypothetical protein